MVTSAPDPGLEIVPLSAALGAEIRGVDLARPLDQTTFTAIHAAWLEHLILLFRGQTMDDGDLVAFSRRFGPLDIAPPNENGTRFVGRGRQHRLLQPLPGARRPAARPARPNQGQDHQARRHHQQRRLPARGR
jgi:alpha-ketoglutarate-dependent taurine dioxygenase